MWKQPIIKQLQRYVQKYFASHPEVKLVVVVGSVGKTSTKHMLATLLEQKYRVRMHAGNYNSEVSAPLAILGLDLPENLKNPLQWVMLLRQARRRATEPTDVDIIIQELATDHPGDIAAFGEYLHPVISIVTAVTPEHMEFFGTLDAVAHEELSVAAYSALLVMNSDDIAPEYVAALDPSYKRVMYGSDAQASYRFDQQSTSSDGGFIGTLITPREPLGYEARLRVTGEHSIRSVLGAVAAATELGLSVAEITAGLAQIRPAPGRMNVLPGRDGVMVIDDSYNSSPAAVTAALKTLYLYGDTSNRQLIAVLGDMRELGDTSPAEHTLVGEQCDPAKLAAVVMVGPDMEQYAAPAARERGCQVHIAANALAAGEYVRSIVQPGAVVLVKGSQNTIFLEECVKMLIDDAHVSELVRQSPDWMMTKNKYFQSLG